MTGPGQPTSNVLQKARQRLLRLGLTDDHILSIPTPANTRFGPTDLDPYQADPHFGPIVQRVVRFLRGGRGLSIAVTDDGLLGDARVHAAVQLAAGLTRHGIHVVVVDMDLQRPGLNGLISETHSEGLIDMVRFGRSCRSVLQKPLSGGPSLLAAGSFPVQEPLPLDEDSIRSILHRVSLHCELALYVAPLLPDGNILNPVVRLCEHVVLVQSVSELAVDVVERIQLMQQARLPSLSGQGFYGTTGFGPIGTDDHFDYYPLSFLGLQLQVPIFQGTVVQHKIKAERLFEGSRPPVQQWRPRFLYADPSPGVAASDVAATDVAAAAAGAAAASAAASPAPALPSQELPAQELPSQELPAPERIAPVPVEAPIPHIAWTGRRPQPQSAGGSDEAGIPEIHLPDEAALAGPFSSQAQPFESMAEGRGLAEAPATHEAQERDLSGAAMIENLWSEREQPADELSALDEERQYRESQGSYAQGADAFARGESEPGDFRMKGFDSSAYEDTETEFAYDDGNNWSRTPLYILVTLLVLVCGFFGWALWTKRGIEQQVGQQLLETDWIDNPQSADRSAVPDDAAALPQANATLPTDGLKRVGDANDTQATKPPSAQPKAADTPSRKQSADSRATSPPPAVQKPARTADTQEMTPIPVPSQESANLDNAAEEKSSSAESGALSAQAPVTAIAGGTGASEYTVHVGSFRHLEQAYQEIAALQKRGYTSRAARTDLGSKGIWYRVYVGGFATRSEAEKIRDSILELPEYNYAQVKRLP